MFVTFVTECKSRQSGYHGIMGRRFPDEGVAEIQKMSPPSTVGDAADMQLCVIKQGSPPVLENVAFFVTDLLTSARCPVCILNISIGVE